MRWLGLNIKGLEDEWSFPLFSRARGGFFPFFSDKGWGIELGPGYSGWVTPHTLHHVEGQSSRFCGPCSSLALAMFQRRAPFVRWIRPSGPSRHPLFVLHYIPCEKHEHRVRWKSIFQTIILLKAVLCKVEKGESSPFLRQTLKFGLYWVPLSIRKSQSRFRLPIAWVHSWNSPVIPTANNIRSRLRLSGHCNITFITSIWTLVWRFSSSFLQYRLVW